MNDKEALPLFHALAYNTYFTTLVVKGMKFDKISFQGITTMLCTSTTLLDVTLSEISISGKGEWKGLFDEMTKANMTSSKLTCLNLSDSQMDDKAMFSFSNFIRTKSVSFVKLNVQISIVINFS